MALHLDTLTKSTFKHCPEIFWERAGLKNFIELPRIQKDFLANTIGNQIGKGTSGTIYEVLNSKQVYKIIPLTAFGNGREVLVSWIASELGIAPQFYGACLATSPNQAEVIIEMDHAGKTLLQWIEEFKSLPNGDTDERTDFSFSEERKQAMIELRNKKLENRELNNQRNSSMQKMESLENIEHATIVKLFSSKENFLFQLFDLLKQLANKNVSYSDVNYGNLIVTENPTKLRLIDFGSSNIHNSPNEAVQQLFLSRKVCGCFEEFIQINGLSEPSKQLILWFTERRKAVRQTYNQPSFSTPRFNPNPLKPTI